MPQPPKRPAPTPPGATYGLRAREVGADAALAAGLAHEGTLEQDGALRLFYLAAATQASGRLTLGAPPRAFALSFRRGTVVHAASSHPDDALAPHLVRRGVVRPFELARAEAAGGDLVGALIGLGIVAPAHAASALQEHGAALVLGALAVEAGTWRWEPDAAAPASSFPLGPSWALLPAAVRALEPAAAQRRLGDREGRSARRVGGRIRAEELRLTPVETRLLAGFDGERSVAELARSAPADGAVVLRLALLLAETELLAFGEPRKLAPAAPAVPSPPPAAPHPAKAATAAPKRPTARPPSPSPSPARPAAPAPRAAPAPVPVLDGKALEAAVTRLASADLFEVLGVKRDATTAAIKAAYFSLAKTYHPDTVPPATPPEVRRLCADVFSRVSEAWSVIGEDARRAEYLHLLETGGTEKVDVQAIFEAENLFQQGTLLVKARRYEEARTAFEDAIRLYSDEPEFGVWKAWCDFLLAPDRARAHAASAGAIEDALRQNPRCTAGYLFLGLMAKLAGDVPTAERHLRRGVALAPDHAELQRELKYLRK